MLEGSLPYKGLTWLGKIELAQVLARRPLLANPLLTMAKAINASHFATLVKVYEGIGRLTKNQGFDCASAR